MNSGFNDYADLLNITTSSQDLEALQDEVKALEEEVADNKLDIAANNLAIGVNSGLISTNSTNINNNGVLISNNTSSINTNSQGISNNLSSINFNTTSISSLNQEVLKKDGSVPLDIGYTPSSNQDIATKDYVDSHSTSTSYLKVDGSNSMTGDLNLDSNDLKLNTVNTLSATGNYVDLNVHSDFSLLTFGNTAMAVGGSQIHVNRLFRVVNNDIECSNLTTGNINGTNFNTLVSDVNTNTTNISGKLSKSGDTMTGILDMGNNSITNCGGILVSSIESLLDSPITLLHQQSNGANPNSSHAVLQIVDRDNISSFGDIDMKNNEITNITKIATASSIQFIGTGNTLLCEFQVGNISIPEPINWTFTMNGINTFQFGTLSGITSNIQGQFNTINNNVNSNTSTIATHSNLILVNGNNIFTNTNDINTANNNIGINSINISTNANNISSNTGNISTNSNNISSNDTDISNLQTSVSINTGNIASNANAIPLKVSKSGDTMTGDLNMDISTDIRFGDGGANVPTSLSGLIYYSIESSSYHNLALIGAKSTADPNSERHVLIEGYLEIEDGLKIDGDYGNMWGSGGAVGSGFYGKKQLWLKNISSGGDAGWFIGCQADSATTGNDNELYFQTQYYNGTQRLSAFIQDARTNVQMNHTYSHRCMPMFEFTEDKVGLIVETTGRYMDLLSKDQDCSQIDCIKINDALPMVRICNEEKSKKVFGVISNEEEKTRTWSAGNFVSLYDKVEGDNRVVVNGGGEGSIYVCNKNGNLENGDYICSSGINGYGMKQDDDLLHNYTVARITMDVDFNPQLEEVKIYKGYDEEKKEIIWEVKRDENGDIVYKPQYEMIELDDGLKVCFVGCVYLTS